MENEIDKLKYKLENSKTFKECSDKEAIKKDFKLLYYKRLQDCDYEVGDRLIFEDNNTEYTIVSDIVGKAKIGRYDNAIYVKDNFSYYYVQKNTSTLVMIIKK